MLELVKDKRIEGIESGLRDESDKDGMRNIVESNDTVGEVVLNHLFSQTQIQSLFLVNMVALHQGQPKLLKP